MSRPANDRELEGRAGAVAVMPGTREKERLPKMRFTVLTCLVIAIAVLAGVAEAAIVPVDLRCEYRDKPLNVDLPRPRLGWILSSKDRDQSQSAFQIAAASTPAILEADQGDLWDSGKVLSDQTGQISYSGKLLVSGQACYWKVRVWDSQDRVSPWSESSNWSMGPLGPQDWRASWITSRVEPPGPSSDALPLYRKSFHLEKPPSRAVLHICGLGQYELYLNGGKVSDAILEPGWTDYQKTCLYQSYDVTARLKAGNDAIGVMLGNGMYNVPRTEGRYEKFVSIARPPKVIAQLQVWYQDGSSQTIGTDNSWKVTPGPITFSNAYGGEDYDARLEKAGWNEPVFDDSGWQDAVSCDGPGGLLCGASRSALPITVSAALQVKTITHPTADAWVYDLGQNCSQMPGITVSGASGAAVRLTPGELLSTSGTVSQRSSGGPAWYTYTLKGGAPETWTPRFTYYGSRYIQVTGAVPAGSVNPSHLPEITELHGQFITSASPVTGEFSCSDPLLNRTDEIIRWAMRNNMMSVLTDCPHREKLGWLEQTHLVGPSLSYNFQIPVLLTKVCCDISDAQLDNGMVPDIAPEYTVFGGGFRDSPEWGSACVLIPWQLYQWYGDLSILSRQYTTMQHYIHYLGTRANDNLLSFGLGDWYDIGPKAPGPAQLTPSSLTATAFYYRDICILQQIAKLLGRQGDSAQFADLASHVGESFNRAFYNPETHNYATASQTANAIPLVFGLAPAQDRTAIADNIVKDIRQRHDGLTAGDIGYRYLLRALADADRSDVIFDINRASDKPGYGMILAKGATSLTEAWDARPEASQDHFMLGHIMEWFYSDLVGVQQSPDSVAFRKIVIKPTPVGDVTWAGASFQSASGVIKSSWKITGNQFALDVVIPPNTTAELIFPPRYRKDVVEVDSASEPSVVAGDGRIKVGSGNYHFTSLQSTK
jgi:alpha-L-rhamnosidase